MDHQSLTSPYTVDEAVQFISLLRRADISDAQFSDEVTHVIKLLLVEQQLSWTTTE